MSVGGHTVGPGTRSRFGMRKRSGGERSYHCLCWQDGSRANFAQKQSEMSPRRHGPDLERNRPRGYPGTNRTGRSFGEHGSHRACRPHRSRGSPRSHGPRRTAGRGRTYGGNGTSRSCRPPGAAGPPAATAASELAPRLRHTLHGRLPGAGPGDELRSARVFTDNRLLPPVRFDYRAAICVER